MRTQLAVTFMMFVLPLAVSAQGTQTSPLNAVTSPAGKDPTYLICKLRGSVRTLRVERKKGGPCITTYTKEGVDKVVGESWVSNRCSKVLLNIRDNLQKGNWKCKDISEARVSSSEQ